MPLAHALKSSNSFSFQIVNHMKLRHPHVISLREVFLTQQHLVLVMEFAPGGDLFTYVRSRGGLPETEARWYFQQIVIAVDYCHRLGVCSRDIKLENTLLDAQPGPQGNLQIYDKNKSLKALFPLPTFYLSFSCTAARPLVKLCDFGFSKDRFLHSAPDSRVGTPAYLAPEVIVASQWTRYDGDAADLWSLGVMLYIMVCAVFPFRRKGDEAMKPVKRMDVMLKRIQAVDYKFPKDTDVKVLSEGVTDLIKRLLVREPAKRATLNEVMRHPWFQEGLSPEVLSFNDPLVAKSLAEPVKEEVESEIARIVDEAARGGAVGSHDAAYMDDVDALILEDNRSTDVTEQVTNKLKAYAKKRKPTS